MLKSSTSSSNLKSKKTKQKKIADKKSIESSSSFEKEFKKFFSSSKKSSSASKSPSPVKVNTNNSSPSIENSNQHSSFKKFGFLHFDDGKTKIPVFSTATTLKTATRPPLLSSSRFQRQVAAKYDERLTAKYDERLTDKTVQENKTLDRRNSFSSIYTIQEQSVSIQSPFNQWNSSITNSFQNALSSKQHARTVTPPLARNELYMEAMDEEEYYPMREKLTLHSDTELIRADTEEDQATPIFKNNVSYFDAPETHEKIKALLDVLTDTNIYVNVDGTEATPFDVYWTMLDRLDSIWVERMEGLTPP